MSDTERMVEREGEGEKNGGSWDGWMRGGGNVEV